MNKENLKTVHLSYYALLREKRGVDQETIATTAQTAFDLFSELDGKYNFQLPRNLLKVSVNDTFLPWETVLEQGDQVAFLPPVAGG